MARTVAFYALRGGPNAGVYTTFADAQTAGFMRKQGFGNAAKFGSREEAEAYSTSRPQPETVQRVQGFVARLPFMARLLLFWLFVNVFCFGGYYIVKAGYDYRNCVDNLGDVFCLVFSEIETTFRKTVASNALGFASQFAGGIVLFAAYLANIVNV